ncbi:MAG TPA: tetratricopeptide repeat protein [Methylophilus sp.]|nr:tetratricopeptide repeat protein [Methylophilus sp.]
MANDLNLMLHNAQAAQQAGKPHDALALYQQILTAIPEHLEIQIVCGNLCVETGQLPQAVDYFRSVYQQLHQRRDARANHARDALCYALSAQGNAAHAQGGFETAVNCFSEATKLNPRDAEYWYNLGNAQRELGEPSKALQAYQASLKLNPDDADTHNNMGNVLRELGRLDEAINAYETALKLNPNLHHALAHLIHQKQHACDWHGLDAQIDTLRKKLLSGVATKISPFAFLAMPGTAAAEQLLCANAWNESFAPSCKPISMRVPGHQKKHIHVAYLSADFRQHPLAYLMTDLLAAHDRRHFIVSAYVANRADNSTAERTFKDAVDHWVDITHMNDAQAARRMADDGVDILVDMTGFTQNSRSMIAAYRPATVNINWLGYPGTMGNIVGSTHDRPLFDYLIADAVLVAPDEEKYYAERILRLPCYQPNNQTRPVSESGTRSELGLPEEAFVFCCFNQTFKITSDIFAMWMRLLHEVPNSVLWLLECNRWARDNLQTYTQDSGIDSARLIFAPRTSIDAHLARQIHADLFLDTLPYNAHTTASDALYMGLPLLTCKGTTFASRVAASLLHHVGLDELVTDSLDSYAQCALRLANNPAYLQDVRNKLAHIKQKSDLFNPERFARRLEAEYRRILRE